MGIQESKVVIDTLSEAHSTAVRSGREEIEVKLDEHFLESLRRLWCRLTEPQKESITRKRPSQKRNSPPKQRESVTSIDHKLLMDNVERWSLSTTPLDFFAENGSKLVLTRNALGDITEYMQKLEDTNGYNSVRLRLLQAICYRCKEKLAVKNLTGCGTERLTKIVSQSGVADPKYSKQIIVWVDQGNRIQDICREVENNEHVGARHLANLFFCDQIFDSTIARLPLQKNKDKAKFGSMRTDLIERIRRSRDGLVLENRHKLENFTHSLFEGIWKVVEKVLHSSKWEMQSIPSLRQPPSIAILSPSVSPSVNPSSSSITPPSGVPSPSINDLSAAVQLSPAVESNAFPSCGGAISSSAVLRSFDTQEATTRCRKRRRTLEIQDTPTTQIDPTSSSIVSQRQSCHTVISMDEPAAEATLSMEFRPDSSVSYDSFNPRQHGQPTIPLEEPVGNASLAMQLQSDPFASYDSFNPRQHGQPTMSLDDTDHPITQGTLAEIRFGSGSFSSYDVFNPRQHGQPTIPLEEPAGNASLAMQFGSDPFASYDSFNPRQHGQPTMPLNDTDHPVTQGTLAEIRFGSGSFSSYNVFNPRQHGQPTMPLEEPAGNASLAMQLQSDSFASYDSFNPRQHGQPTMPLNDTDHPITQGTLAEIQFRDGSFSSDGVFNTRKYGQFAISSDVPAAQSALASTELDNDAQKLG